MKRAALVVMLSCWVSSALALEPAEIRKTLDDFRGASWPKVVAAVQVMQKDPATYVPILLTVAHSELIVPLKDTADLIYPGAESFYGHGYVLAYELNHLGDRAGWVLESIAGKKFGFEGDGFQLRKPEIAAAARVKARAAAAAHFSRSGK